MGKKKIVIDTNNLISALGWRGKSRVLFQMVINGEFNLFISAKQLNEIKRVLKYPKFSFTNIQKNQFLKILKKVATIINTEHKIDIVRDPKDNMLLEAAIESKAKFIISGDKDLLSLKEYKGVKIVTVSDFLEEI